MCALLDDPPAQVLSLGGGAVAPESVQARLARHTVILLDVDSDTAWRRSGNKGRPLARDRRRFDELHAARNPLYERLADAILPTSTRDEVRRAMPAVRALGDAPAGTKLLWAMTAGGAYPVYVGDGVIGFDALPGQRRFLITDENVGPLHAGAVAGPVVSEQRVTPGEEYKNLATAEQLLRGLAAAGMARDDHVVALGGGVVGDVAGFCAAVYQRGVPVVQLPTTLVAQVDSAYGGKTGVDLPEGKNYAGAYHQPAAVLADPAALATLPDAERSAGWAEVIKTGLLAGGALWRRVKDAPDASVDRDLIVACARTKLSVVAEDERDSGRRQVLNLGHTVGHAIETATGYSRYRHGEAVALGLLAALTLSELHHLRGDVAELLTARGLPTKLDPAVDVDAVCAAVGRDKKKRGGVVGFVLLEGPGEPQVGVPVPDDALRAAVAELAR